MQQIPLKNRPGSIKMALAKCLLRLYPVSWRERYSQEMLTILEEHPPTFWVLGDLFFNLCDAHLHTEIVPTRISTLLKQRYNSVTSIFCACLLFCMLTPGNSITYTINTFFSTGNISVFAEFINGFETPYLMISLLLLLLIGMIPLLIFTFWQAIQARRMRTLFLCLIGIFNLFIASQAGSAVDTIADPLYNSIYGFFGGEATSFSSYWSAAHLVMAFSGFSPGYILFVCIGIWALWIALQQSIPTINLTKFTAIPALFIPLVMLAYIFNPLSSFIASPFVRAGIVEGKHIIFFTYIRLDIVFLILITLIGWYGFLHIYQVQLRLTIKTE